MSNLTPERRAELRRLAAEAEESWSNAEFADVACNAVPDLLDEIERLEAQRGKVLVEFETQALVLKATPSPDGIKGSDVLDLRGAAYHTDYSPVWKALGGHAAHGKRFRILIVADEPGA